MTLFRNLRTCLILFAVVTASGQWHPLRTTGSVSAEFNTFFEITRGRELSTLAIPPVPSSVSTLIHVNNGNLYGTIA
jgi:hypothetical protein